MIQADLEQLGIRVQVVPLEFRAVLDRIFQTHDYEAAVLALGGGDVDPNSQMNVWLSSGSDHLWNIGQPHPATPWEAEIDQLMEKQLSTVKPDVRKHRVPPRPGNLRRERSSHLPGKSEYPGGI